MVSLHWVRPGYRAVIKPHCFLQLIISCRSRKIQSLVRTSYYNDGWNQHCHKKAKLLEIIFLNSGDSTLINSTIKNRSMIAVFLELIIELQCITVNYYCVDHIIFTVEMNTVTVFLGWWS